MSLTIGDKDSEKKTCEFNTASFGYEACGKPAAATAEMNGVQRAFCKFHLRYAKKALKYGRGSIKDRRRRK